MRNFDKKNLRPSTIYRNNHILDIYEEVLCNLGDYKMLVPRSYIYEKIQERTGYCIRKIEDVINHYKR